jgi:hypothetical protein
MKKSTTITSDIDVSHVEYVIVNGIRFNRESKLEAEHRQNYEPGGKFEHLAGRTCGDWYLDH